MSDADARIRELERRNAALDDQVKLLVRAEQSVYLSQRALERQLARVDALRRFAVDVAGLESRAQIVGRAADVLFGLFPLDQCVGFVADEGGMLVPVAIRAAAGREPRMPLADRDREPLRVLLDPMPDAIVERASTIRGVCAQSTLLVDRIERIFEDPALDADELASALIVIIPFARGTRAAGVLVFRRMSGPISFHEELPVMNDPFLGVIAQQVAAAFANARLAERERLAAVGELAAVVAHEVRNPLGAIFNSVSMLARLTAGRPDEEHLVDIVREESERLNQIVSDLIEFARPHAPAPREESLPAIVQGAIESVRARFAGAAIALTVDDTPPVWVDPRMLRQALVNLLLNAVQASPEQLGVTVRVARSHDDGARIDVEDRGLGIPDAVAARVFEPFFTTKASGTGLGLAVVKRVADAHRGSVEVRPTPGGGTTFTLTLPAVLEPR